MSYNVIYQIGYNWSYEMEERSRQSAIHRMSLEILKDLEKLEDDKFLVLGKVEEVYNRTIPSGREIRLECHSEFSKSVSLLSSDAQPRNFHTSRAKSFEEELKEKGLLKVVWMFISGKVK